MKQQKVDPFIPVQKHPLEAKQAPAKPVSIVGHDITPPKIIRKPALDHLRPWRNVQRPQGLPAKPGEPPRMIQQKVATPPKPAKAPAPQVRQATTATRPVIAPSPAPEPVQQPQAPAIEQASETPAQRRRWAYPLQLLLGSIAILAIGALAQIVYVGEAAIALYGLYALIKHITSRTTFLLALVSFGCIILMLFIRPDPILMKNFATYAFLFLFIAVASLLREARE